MFSRTITEHDGIHKIIISFAPFSSQLRRLIELNHVNCYIFLTIHALKSSHGITSTKKPKAGFYGHDLGFFRN